jgi:hypothetical protein
MWHIFVWHKWSLLRDWCLLQSQTSWVLIL